MDHVEGFTSSCHTVPVTYRVVYYISGGFLLQMFQISIWNKNVLMSLSLYVTLLMNF